MSRYKPLNAAQATLQEFNNIEKVNEGGEEVRVMWVTRHKTARKGLAYLTMTVNEHKMLQNYMYVKRVRPRLDSAAQRLPWTSNWKTYLTAGSYQWMGKAEIQLYS